jgi:hypothetical protein
MRQILIEKYIEPSEVEERSIFIVKRWFNKYDELHSLMGQPAEIWYDSRRKIAGLSWYEKGVKHREGVLPAEIYYNYDGKVIVKYWCKNGMYVAENI